MTATLPILQAVTRVIEAVRADHDGIPEPVVVLGASAPGKHGHFAASTWRERGEGGGEPLHEILLSGESLSRGGIATFGTIVHELAHAYCHAHGIKDTSNRGRYHNSGFKAVAERFGLTIEKAPTIGWSVTDVPASTRARYASVISDLDTAITAFRAGSIEPEETKTRAKYRMTCGCEAEPIPVTKRFLDLDLTCGNCDQTMEVTVLDG